MQGLANNLIDAGIQCWTCPIFDNLFAIVSNAAGAMYERLCLFSVIIFSVLFGFYVINAFWQNIKKGMPDPFFQKSLKPVLIKSLAVLSLLALGLTVPKMISKITFEPVALITLGYSKAMLPQDYKIPDNYSAIKLDDNGFFNPELRDTILQILQSNVANFQVYIKTGIDIADAAFSLPKSFSLGLIVKRILAVFVGLFLAYKFAQLFIKYSFYFMDVIVAMAMFAFFFPLSLILFIFKGAADLPDWLKSLGASLGSRQIKKLIDAIVSVASAILTYTVIMLLVRGYFDSNNMNIDTIQNSAESIFNFNLDNPDAIQITFFGSIVLVFVISYLADKIPNITKEIMSTFNISQEESYSKEMGDNVFKLTEIVATQTKQLVKNIAHPENVKTTDTKAKK